MSSEKWLGGEALGKAELQRQPGPHPNPGADMEALGRVSPGPGIDLEDCPPPTPSLVFITETAQSREEVGHGI